MEFKLYRRRIRCVVLNCTNNGKDRPDLSFFAIPSDPVRREAWLKVIRCKGDVKPNMRVCEVHFELQYFRFLNDHKKLQWHAVPTLNLPVLDQEAEQDSVAGTRDATQIEDEIAHQLNMCIGLDRNIKPLSYTTAVAGTSDAAQIEDDKAGPNKRIKLDQNIKPVSYTTAVAGTSDAAQIEDDKAGPNKRIKLAQNIKPLSYTTAVAGTSETAQIEDEKVCQLNKRIKLDQNIKPVSYTLIFEEDKDAKEAEEPLQEISHGPKSAPKRVKTKTTRKYRPEFKIIALGLYFRSPTAYKVLRDTFGLPQISTLYRLCSSVTTELNEVVLKALELKVDTMSAQEKQCVICVGTIDVAPNIHYDANTDCITGFHEVDGVQTLKPARKVLIVLVRGLFHNWKQPLVYSYLSDSQDYHNVKIFIDKILEAIFRIGLQVRALMSDLQTDVVTGAGMRGCTSKLPFFFHNDKKIYYMYDSNYLLRDIRNSLVTHDFLMYNALVAKWEHIEVCYQTDTCREYKLAPKLTFDHIAPNKYDKNDLRLAAEVFSSEVAAAISTYVNTKKLPASGKVTVQWISMINKLMEMINFSIGSPPEGKQIVFAGSTLQVDFLVGMLSMFQNLRLVNVETRIDETENAAVLEGFRITINSILLLYGDLRTENSWFPPVGLTRDCLNSFFTEVRDKYTLPTTKQVTMCITKSPIFYMFKYFSKKRCSDDLQTFLWHAKQMSSIDKFEDECVESYVDLSAEASAQFSAIELPNENKMEFLALYLLYKGYLQHSDCYVMKLYTCNADNGEDDEGLSEGYTNNHGDVKSMVPREFLEFVELLEFEFKKYFKVRQQTRSVSGLLRFVEDIVFMLPCVCFPLDYIKHLFIRLRLYMVLQYNNKLYKKKKVGHEAFVVNDL